MPMKDRSLDEGEEAETAEDTMPDAPVSEELESHNSGLIKVKLGDDTIHVHPTALEEHKNHGWKVA
jgi:hypothetical protein